MWNLSSTEVQLSSTDHFLSGQMLDDVVVEDTNMPFINYEDAVVGVGGVVWKEDCKAEISPAGSPWSSIVAGGADSGNIASHHDATGYRPNSGTPDLSYPGTATNTSLDTRYACSGLDAQVSADVDANGFQMSWTTSARYLISPVTFTKNIDGVGSVRSVGWDGSPSSSVALFSANAGALFWIGQKDGSGNIVHRWANSDVSYMGDAVNDTRSLGGSTSNATRYNGETFKDDLDQDVTMHISLTPVGGGVYEMVTGYNGMINTRSLTSGTDLPSEFLSTLIIGMRNTTGGSASPYPIKDIVLATTPVVRVVHPTLAKWVATGDSIADSGLYNTTAYQGQSANWNHVMANSLAASGLYFGDAVNAGNGGFSLAGLLAVISEVTSENPTVVTMQVGTNDLLGLNPTQYQSDLNEYIDTCFGIVGGGGTQCELFVLNTPPPRFDATTDPTQEANHALIRAMHLAAPADFRTRNPGHSGAVVVGYDAWGEGLVHADWEKTDVYSHDGTHHDTTGTALAGTLMAASIIGHLLPDPVPVPVVAFENKIINNFVRVSIVVA